MVSIPYIKEILSAHGISQAELSKKWTELRKDGKKKYQSNISTAMSRDYTDSLTFVRAIAELSGVPLGDIVDEISFVEPDNSIIYHVREEEGSYQNSVAVPITKESGNEGGSLTLPKEWVRPGVNRVTRVTSSSMSPNFGTNDFIGSVLVNKSHWNHSLEGKPCSILVEGKTILTRVKRVGDGLIYFTSDHPDKGAFPDFSVEKDNIEQIWEIAFKVSWDFPKPYQSVEDKVANMESEMNSMKKVLDKIMFEIRGMRD